MYQRFPKMTWPKCFNLEWCYMESLMAQMLTWQDFQLDGKTSNDKLKNFLINGSILRSGNIILTQF